MLAELVARLRSGELSLAEFAAVAADNFVYRDQSARTYPETDGDEDLLDGVSNASLNAYRQEGLLTADEVQAIYDALPAARA